LKNRSSSVLIAHDRIGFDLLLFKILHELTPGTLITFALLLILGLIVYLLHQIVSLQRNSSCQRENLEERNVKRKFKGRMHVNGRKTTQQYFVPVYFFTFVTGAAGLIYEVTWQKYLSRILGSDTVATAVILATFLGGLSGGYYLCGKLTTKVRNQFKAYALLEGIIAVWGFLFPVIFERVDSATRGWSFSPPVLIILQGLFCSALLMGIPTVCMGGTIPFLTRGIAQSVEEATRVHAEVYGINTAEHSSERSRRVSS
jgi:hypothetical protein